MWKVSIVGHSQVPEDLTVHGAEIRIFSKGGGRADEFFEDEVMSEVLGWQHDLCILWLGSNDIDYETNPQTIADNIIEIVEQIEEDCGAVVWVCLVEPRFYQDDFMTHEDYRKVQRSVNRKLQRKLSNEFIHFNSNSWVDALNSGGVHWSSEGKARVKQKIKNAIRHFMMDSDSE